MLFLTVHGLLRSIFSYGMRDALKIAPRDSWPYCTLNLFTCLLDIHMYDLKRIQLHMQDI